MGLFDNGLKESSKVIGLLRYFYCNQTHGDGRKE
jgi:hypothetical protein